jgi:hypothetical protein
MWLTDYWKKIFIFCLSGCLVCPNKVTRNKKLRSVGCRGRQRIARIKRRAEPWTPALDPALDPAQKKTCCLACRY